MTKAVQTTKNVVKTIEADHAIPNKIDLTNLAKEAISALNSSDVQKGKANAIMTYVIAQAWFNMTFECVITYGANAEQKVLDTFDLDMIANKTGIQKSDGKMDTKKSVARLNQVAMELFDVHGEFDNKGNLIKGKRFNASQLNTFNRALNLVNTLINMKVRTDQIELNDSKTLCVPFYLFNKKPESKYQTALATYETMKEKIVPILSFDDLIRNVDQISGNKKKGAKAKANPAQILTDNLHSVTRVSKELKEKLLKGEEVIGNTLKKDLMATYLALKALFETEEKIEKTEAAKEAKQAQAKAS